VLSEIAEVASERSVDVTVVAGDLFDVSSPSPEDEAIVYRALLELAEVGPVIVVGGNHDSAARLEAVKPLLVAKGAKNADLASEIDSRFAAVTAALEPYRRGTTFVAYTDLTQADTKALSQVIDALAEPLSKVSKQVVSA